MSRRSVGLFFVLVSLFVSSFNLLFTGAVVGVSGVSLSLIAVVFFVAGVVLIFTGVTLETLVVDENTVSPFEVIGRIENVAGGKDVAVVVDTSILGAYSEKGVRGLMGGLRKGYGGAVVSDSVLAELRGDVKNLREPVLKKSVAPTEGYEKYMKEARGYLEKGRKAFYYDEIIPIILGEKEAPESRHESALYVAAVKKLMRHVKSNYKEMTRENLLAVADRHWKVSDVDVDVFAAVLAEAKSGKKVVIAERDVDFEDAVREVKRVNPKLGSLIYYVNCYAEAA